MTATQPVTTRRRRRDLLEVAIVYGMVLLIFWTPRPWTDLLLVVAAASILAITLDSFDGLQPMGLCRANLFRSLWAVAAALAIAALAVMLAGRFHTLHVSGSSASFAEHFCAYALWACIQQVVLQCFFLSRLLRLLGDATSAAAMAATLFAFAHLPSPVLTLITLFCGLAACLFFLHYRNLYPLVIAHAILGISIAITFPASMLHNMRVGLSYLTWVDKPANLPAP